MSVYQAELSPPCLRVSSSFCEYFHRCIYILGHVDCEVLTNNSVPESLGDIRANSLPSCAQGELTASCLLLARVWVQDN